MKLRTAFLLLILPVLAPHAIAAPMSAQRYAQDVMYEVEYQNFTCGQLQQLADFLEELRSCGPPGAEADPGDLTAGTSNRPTPGMDFGDTLRLETEARRLCVRDCSFTSVATRSVAATGRVTVTQADPSKVCRRVEFPQQVLTPLGPTARQAMATIGVRRDMDVVGIRDIASPMPMVGARAVIGGIQRPLQTAMQLKNCRL